MDIAWGSANDPQQQSIDTALRQLLSHGGKLLYTVTGATFIKFITLPNPKRVHEARQEAGLVPVLYRCDALPRGYSRVATELLAEADGWRMLHQFRDGDPELQQCLNGVEHGLASAHAIQVQHGGGHAPAVHGDMRGSNIIVRAHSADTGSGTGWEVKFVDLH